MSPIFLFTLAITFVVLATLDAVRNAQSGGNIVMSDEHFTRQQLLRLRQERTRRDVVQGIKRTPVAYAESLRSANRAIEARWAIRDQQRRRASMHLVGALA